jgi:hypothetical protein
MDPKRNKQVMNKDSLVELARRYYISDTGLSEAHLVRKIQVAQGDVDCFQTGRQGCTQVACRWRQECFQGSIDDGRTDSLPGREHPQGLTT